MKNYKTIIYILLCISFSIVFGGAVYEHIAIWPTAYEAPPKSLSMFQGEYGLYSAPFWQSIHPVTLVLFIATLIVSWKTDRRKFVLIPFIGYVIILIITSIYFVPELIDIISSEYAENVDQSLVERGALWEKLSIVRMIIGILLMSVLYFGLTKSA